MEEKSTSANNGEMMAVWQLQRDVPLRHMTNLNLGGPARFFSDVADHDDIETAIAWSKEQTCALAVLGAGSNVVVADRGFDGLVVRWQKPTEADVSHIFASATEHGSYVQLRVPAWCDWDRLVADAVAASLGGLECLSGIPGLAGAAPIQNIGAYGQQLSDSLIGLEAIEVQTGRLVRLEHRDCKFGYRTSFFKHQILGAWIVTAITLQLKKCVRAEVAYPQLIQFLRQAHACNDAFFGLGDIRQAVLALRAQKSMLVDPTDPNSKSVGSFFVNPVIKASEAAGLLAKYPSMPQYPAGTQGMKLSAAWLIEKAGFTRGYPYGSVGISSRHSLALINRQDATAQQLVRFAQHIQQQVMQRFGVWLMPEPHFMGFSPSLDWTR